MTTPAQSLQLTDLIHLKINDLYEEDAIDGIKDELEATHGVKLVKNIDQYYCTLTCKNSALSLGCPYFIRFKILFRYNRPNHRLLVLQFMCVNHRKQCHNSQTAHFLKNKQILNHIAPYITKILRERYQNGQPIKNPTQIIQILCKKFNLEKNFLYNGLQGLQAKRKLKKKFDNLVADARRKCKQYIHSSQQKQPDQYQQYSPQLSQINLNKLTNTSENLDIKEKKQKIEQINFKSLQSKEGNRLLRKKIFKVTK